MLKFQLDKTKKRPIVRVQLNNHLVKCLIDTGAEIPVWNGSVEKFLDIFKEATLVATDFKISGFGGDGGLYSVYKIPTFILSDGSETVKIHNMYCALTTEEALPCRFIISANMLGMFNYKISNSTGAVTVEYDRTDYYMVLTYDGSVTVFEQNADKHGLLNIAKNIGST